jgi:2-isopropylmalate synthase (EC 2.3.3.13)
LTELGVDLSSEEALNDAFRRFKDLADKKREIFDEDIQALVSEVHEDQVEQLKLVSLKVCSETGEVPTATLVISVAGEEKSATAQGAGPVDAAFVCIENMMQSGANLQLYSVNNITSGTDAQGEVNVRLERAGRIVTGQGADTDIVVASAKAYLNALDRLQKPAERAHPQMGDV